MRTQFGDTRLPGRFWQKVARNEAGCWIWTACLNKEGYGQFRIYASTKNAYRFAYEVLIGEPPSGMVLDHVCHSIDRACAGGPSCLHRRCVNPGHLEPVTPAENGARSAPAIKTRCINGHEFTAANTYDRSKNRGNGGGTRVCRACNAAAARRYKARRAS